MILLKSMEEDEIMQKTYAILITLFLTAGCFGIGWLVDLIKVCTGKFTKKDGTPWVID